MGFVIHLVRLIIGYSLRIALLVARTLLIPLLLILGSLLIRSVWFVIRVIGLSIVSIFVGVPTSIRRMAKVWSKSIISAGVPLEYEIVLNRIMEALAFLTILAGWVSLGGLTYLVWTMFIS